MERVGAACAGDRLQDDRVAELFDGREDVFRGVNATRLRDAEARRGDALLHDLLVAEADDRVDRHTRHAPTLAHPRGEHDERLPIREDTIDVLAAHPVRRAVDDVFLVHDPGDLEIVREIGLHAIGQGPARRITDAIHRRADFGEAARKIDHLLRIGRREKDDSHGGGS